LPVGKEAAILSSSLGRGEEFGDVSRGPSLASAQPNISTKQSKKYHWNTHTIRLFLRGDLGCLLHLHLPGFGILISKFVARCIDQATRSCCATAKLALHSL
jgi:hypothetical protein